MRPLKLLSINGLHYKIILYADRKTGKWISQLEDESSCFLWSVSRVFNWLEGDDDKWTEVIRLWVDFFFRTNAGFFSGAGKRRELRTGHIIQPFCKNTLIISLEVALILPSVFENVPPVPHSLCITECLIWFLRPSRMNGQNGLVVLIFWPYLCSCDSAALLSLRPGSLRAWILLLGSSSAPRQQVPLMMRNYACGTSITVQKYSELLCVISWGLA